MNKSNTPNLMHMVSHGAVGAMTVRTASKVPSTQEGYAALGAGTRVEANDQSASAFDASAPFLNGTGEAGTAAAALSRRLGAPVATSGVVVVGSPATSRLNRGKHLTSNVGALGAALHKVHKTTAVIGNADFGRPPQNLSGGPSASQFRPSAIALMDKNGLVDFGDVGANLLDRVESAPFGYQASFAKMMDAARRALLAADVILVDPGDMDRSSQFSVVARDSVAKELRREELRRTDALLGEMAQLATPATTILVVSVDPIESEWRLTPVVASGSGITHGYLHSPSTRRLGLVTLTDIAPTVLHAVSAPVPDGMIGHSLRIHRADPKLEYLSKIDRDAAYRERIYLGLTIGYIVLQALVYLAAIFGFARAGEFGRARGLLRFVVLAIAAWPLSTFLFRAIPDVARFGWPGAAMLALIDAGVVALAVRFRRTSLSPLAWILGATVALLVADVGTGARLQTSSLLGYSLHTAARFTGLGNTAFAALAASTLLLAAIRMYYAERAMDAFWGAFALFAIVAFVDGAPFLGSDVGGILTLIPVFGLTLLAFSKRRIVLRSVLMALLVAVAVVAGAAAIDMGAPARSQTHLGQLASQVRSHGASPLKTTIARKVATNFRTYKSPWGWIIVIISVYMLYVLGWARGWSELLPPGSPLRIGVVSTLAAGLLGYALNDSGVIVTAVVFVYLGPFLTLIALERAKGGPVLYTNEST